MYVPRKKYLDASGRPNRSGSAELTGSVRFGQPNQNRTKTLHKSRKVQCEATRFDEKNLKFLKIFLAKWKDTPMIELWTYRVI